MIVQSEDVEHFGGLDETQNEIQAASMNTTIVPMCQPKLSNDSQVDA